jgi:hypothetical protein
MMEGKRPASRKSESREVRSTGMTVVVTRCSSRIRESATDFPRRQAPVDFIPSFAGRIRDKYQRVTYSATRFTNFSTKCTTEQIWCTSTPWKNGSDKLSCCSKRARPRCVSPRLITRFPNTADIDFLATQARITTKYHIPNLDTERYASRKRKRASVDENEKTDGEAPRVPRATLEVKAYDPVSGTNLKFKTEKSADVGRLIAGVGRIGRQMAALPEKAEGMGISRGTPRALANMWVAAEDATIDDAPTADGAEANDEAPQEAKPAPTATGGGKKKKKGKK